MHRAAARLRAQISDSTTGTPSGTFSTAALPLVQPSGGTLSTKKRGALGIVLYQRCRSLRRTSNVSGTGREMLELKESFERWKSE
jgi:hypothetical protein